MGFCMGQKSDSGSGKGKGPAITPVHAARGPSQDDVGWANGLRQLYDSVVSEPLPDSFADLLKKLDQSGHD